MVIASLETSDFYKGNFFYNIFKLLHLSHIVSDHLYFLVSSIHSFMVLFSTLLMDVLCLFSQSLYRSCVAWLCCFQRLITYIRKLYCYLILWQFCCTVSCLLTVLVSMLA